MEIMTEKSKKNYPEDASAQENNECVSIHISADLHNEITALIDKRYSGSSYDSICELLLWRGIGRTEQIWQARENGGEW